MLLTIAWACQRILFLVIFGIACYCLGWRHGTLEAWVVTKGSLIANFDGKRFRAARERINRLESDLLMLRLEQERKSVRV